MSTENVFVKSSGCLSNLTGGSVMEANDIAGSSNGGHVVHVVGYIDNATLAANPATAEVPPATAADTSSSRIAGERARETTDDSGAQPNDQR